MPTQNEVKARKADREFNGVEYARDGPPGPVLALLRSLFPTTGLVVGSFEFDRYAGRRERVGLDWRPGSGGGSPPQRERWGGAIPDWQVALNSGSRGFARLGGKVPPPLSKW